MSVGMFDCKVRVNFITVIRVGGERRKSFEVRVFERKILFLMYL